MNEENEREYRNMIVCRFFEKVIESDRVRDHCHLTGKIPRTSSYQM